MKYWPWLLCHLLSSKHYKHAYCSKFKVVGKGFLKQVFFLYFVLRGESVYNNYVTVF